MKREIHRWHSPRLGIELGVVVYGHWGTAAPCFPTSAGDEFELEGQGMVGALADFIDAASEILQHQFINDFLSTTSRAPVSSQLRAVRL